MGVSSLVKVEVVTAKDAACSIGAGLAAAAFGGDTGALAGSLKE